MNTIRGNALFNGILCVMGIIALAPAARADLLISANIGRDGFPLVERYSNIGVDLGAFAGVPDESIDNLFYAPTGKLYALGNTLGNMTIYRFNPGTFSAVTTEPSSNPNIDNSFASMTIGWGGTVLVASGNIGNNSRGVLQYDPVTLQYIKTVVTIPNTLSVGDITFGPDNDLYVAKSNTVVRYSQLGDGTITADTSFNIPLTTGAFELEFSPIDPGNLYLLTANPVNSSLQYHIDRYNITTGAFVDTFVTTTTLANARPGQFAIGTDGTIYLLDSPNTVLIFDAQTGQLASQFSIPGGFYGDAGITFFPSAVPEPASLSLLGIATLSLLCRRKKTV